MTLLRNTVLPPLAIAALFGFLVVVSWVGYLGSDDATYIRGAYGWLEAFPYVGGHGTIRYTMTLPIAGAFFVFGENEVSAALPSLFYSLAVIFLLVRICRSYLGTLSGLIVGILLGASPLMVVSASYASIDIVEAFFVVASLLLFLSAAAPLVSKTQKPAARRLIVAGCLAGFAFLTRETAVFLIVFYGVLFLMSFGFRRRYYWWMALGFIAVWGAEVLYLWAMTGDPFYRVTISLNHDSTIDRLLPWAGNITAHPVFDPLLVLLFNQEFALFFWLAIPVIIYQMCKYPLQGEKRKIMLVTLSAAALWFVLSAVAVTLLPLNPRYFLVVFLLTAVATTASAERLWHAGSMPKRVVMAAGCMVIASNLAALYLENKELRFGEKQLVALAEANSETIYSDPMTIYRAEHLLRWADEGQGVNGTPPPPGSLYLYNPINANAANRFVDEDAVGRYVPGPGWVLIAEIRPGRRWMASIVDRLGLADFLPAEIRKLLFRAHSGVSLMRVAGEPKVG